MDTLTRRFRVSLHGFSEGKGKSFRRLQWAGQGEVQEKAGEERRINLPHFWNLGMLCPPPQTSQPPPTTKHLHKQTKQGKDYQKSKQMSQQVVHYVPDRGFWGEASPHPYGGTSSYLILAVYCAIHLLCDTQLGLQLTAVVFKHCLGFIQISR